MIQPVLFDHNKIGMSRFAERLAEIKERCTGDYSFTEEDREFLHNAYWNGDAVDQSNVLMTTCWEADPLDMPILLDAASPTSLWVNRCDAAQALGALGESGRRALHVMLARETHYIVRFYVMRELIDLEDELCLPLLDRPIPPKSSPSRRSLWIYGNFERDAISKEQALKFVAPLLQDKKGRTEWLLTHISES